MIDLDGPPADHHAEHNSGYEKITAAYLDPPIAITLPDGIASSCLQVFALGGSKGELDAANNGYFAVRGLLANPLRKRRASLLIAACWPKAARSWCG
jgi:hypothetical protein